ncbi:MAG: D-alanine--D-alanine ligase family protein [Armatimonadota bacterium]
MSKLNVAVLMGGKSDERAVSLVTGQMIINALNPDKYVVTAIDTASYCDTAITGNQENSPKSMQPLRHLTQSDSVPVQDTVSSTLKGIDCDRHKSRPDVAFIALHGRYGEDGTVQGMLELLEIPYVGSGVLSSALAMDKIMTRKMMKCDGIPVPAGVSFSKNDDRSAAIRIIESETGYPAVVKPNRQGSTIGLSIAKSREELVSALDLAFKYDDNVLIEQFVKGVEITVPVLGNDVLRVLPIVEIVPDGGFYDYHAKYTDGATEEIVPARVPEAQYKHAEELALMCHKTLGCRGMSRTDMIVADDGIYVLETNTIPGMTPTSLLPRSAKAAGIEFIELLDILINLALER